jgi:hypothetical protein
MHVPAGGFCNAMAGGKHHFPSGFSDEASATAIPLFNRAFA